MHGCLVGYSIGPIILFNCMYIYYIYIYSNNIYKKSRHIFTKKLYIGFFQIYIHIFPWNVCCYLKFTNLKERTYNHSNGLYTAIFLCILLWTFNTVSCICRSMTYPETWLSFTQASTCKTNSIQGQNFISEIYAWLFD